MTQTIAYFDGLSGQWNDKYLRPSFQRRLHTTLAWVNDEPAGASLLDFGCGSGVILRALLAKGFTVTGVDRSARMIEAARATLQSAGILDRYRLEWIEEDGIDGNYARATYRGVICLGVLEYAEDPRSLLAHVASLIEVGGFLLLSVPNQNSLLRKLEQFVHRHPQLFRRLRVLAHLTGPDNYLRLQQHQFTVPPINSLLSELGLRLERSAYQVSPFALRSVENHRHVGMNIILKYRRILTTAS